MKPAAAQEPAVAVKWEKNDEGLGLGLGSTNCRSSEGVFESLIQYPLPLPLGNIECFL